jgi:predicted MFS family arabinose efflux permease
MSALRLCFADPSLRAAGAVILLQGAVICSFAPYFSTLAVTTYGFGDTGFAVLLAVSTLVSVAASVAGGIRADQTARRRAMTLASSGCLVAGLALMVLAPAPLTFVLATALLMPLGSVTFGQVFGLARQAATQHPAEERDAILAVIRALFALPFVVVLPLWALAFQAGAEVTSIFPVGLALAIAMLLIVLRHWPRDGATDWADRPSGLRFREAMAELGRPSLALRVAALGAIHAATTVYMAILALVMVPEVGRGAPDVALYAGLVAGLEVPFMLLLARLARGRDRTTLILIGASVYGLHVALLPVLAGSWALWLLLLPAAAGAAVILTVPIAYLQDLLADRPGAGASLMAVQRLVGDVLAALCFALGTAVGGYGLVAALGAGVALIGAVTLWAADRKGRARLPLADPPG